MKTIGRFIDPLTDFGFKRLFGNEPNKDIFGRYLRNASIFDSDLKQVFYNKLGFKFLELAKFVKSEQELESDLDRWCYLLKHMGQLEKIPAVFQKRVFRKIFKLAEITKLTKEEKAMYDSNLKARSDYENTMAFAIETACEKATKEGCKTGMEKGLETGMGKGMEKGLKQGVNQGEHNKAANIALKMKLAGFDSNQISELTGLSIEAIMAL